MTLPHAGAPRQAAAFSRHLAALALHVSTSMKTTFLVASLVAVTINAHAQESEEAMPQVDSDKELSVELPAFPKQENLRSFHVSSASGHQFMIDLPSLSVGRDGIVRYTLVSQSRSGALNISYEGFRCETMERKTYAIGRTDGDWTPVARTEWTRISASGMSGQYIALANDYICQGRTIRGSLEEIAGRLRSGQVGSPPGS